MVNMNTNLNFTMMISSVKAPDTCKSCTTLGVLLNIS